MNQNIVQVLYKQKFNPDRSIYNGMYNIAICIPTYKRPLLLKKLIESIAHCNFNTTIKDVNIIVVDNDIEKTAEIIVQNLRKQFNGILKLCYDNYSEKGLVNVRNQLFKIALEFQPDFIVGIDDDEYVSPEWLNELLSSILTTNGEVAVAPYTPVFEPAVPSYISYWFKYPPLHNNQSIKFFHAGNFIARASFLLEHKMEFDQRFNTTGAEDTYFGISVMKNGGKMYWAEKAQAYETFDEKRACLNWLIKRRFRTAITYTYILIVEKSYLLLAKKVLVNFIYLLIGILALLFVLFKFKLRYWGVLKIAESFGGFAGLANIKFHEYKKDK